MRMVFYFIILLLVLGASAYMVFLNQQPVRLILTPPSNGYAYALENVPLGLLVLSFFFSGLIVGYLLSVLFRVLK